MAVVRPRTREARGGAHADRVGCEAARLVAARARGRARGPAAGRAGGAPSRRRDAWSVRGARGADVGCAAMSAVRDSLDGLRLADRQRVFAAAMLDPGLPVPAGVVDPDGRVCPKRFGVYRNNVITGLIEALQDSFPAVCRLVGEEYFRAMARLYVTARPPRSPVLLQYGADFP